MAKKAIVHIGRNKTGSTALQFDLSDKRHLLEGYGYTYPLEHFSHEYLVYELEPSLSATLSLQSKEDMASLSARLRVAFDESNQTVILSSEGFQNCAPLALRQWLGNTETTIVVYLREQVANLASSYQQEVKQLLVTEDFETWAAKYTYNHLDYMDFLDKWSEVFGRDNMIVRPYDRQQLHQQDITADFLSILGITDFAPFLQDRRPDANPSIAGALLEAKRRINRLGLDPYDVLAATYFPLLSLALKFPEYRGKLGIEQQYVSSIRSAMSSRNKMLAKAYMGRDFLFLEDNFPAPTVPEEAEVQTALCRLVELVAVKSPDFAATLKAHLGEYP